ncbi:MAG: aldo/keto reductase [Tissierellia bacterium]|nr:aldo/keto reductase [Tissierellia bacterium]
MMILPKLGQGTWRMGENPNTFKKEVEALQAGIEAGLSLIDTAEMYGEGGAEKVVGEAIKPFYRDNLFLVSKVYPHHAGKDHLERSLHQSLERMGTNYLDLYLLHWRGSIPLEETLKEMERMKSAGLIKNWGVSNFDTEDMMELFRLNNGSSCVVNQVLYHLASRGTEFALREWMRDHDVAMMAYCPLAKDGRRTIDPTEDPQLIEMAHSYDLSVEQLLLAFVLHQNITAIPKASTKEHVIANAAMKDFQLKEEDFNRLSRLYPAPTSRESLDIV